MDPTPEAAQKSREILVFLIRKETKCSRSAAAKRFDPEPIRLGATASVRHRFTDCDLLLLRGLERAAARTRVSDAVEKKLEQWSRPN